MKSTFATVSIVSLGLGMLLLSSCAELRHAGAYEDDGVYFSSNDYDENTINSYSPTSPAEPEYYAPETSESSGETDEFRTNTNESGDYFDEGYAREMRSLNEPYYNSSSLYSQPSFYTAPVGQPSWNVSMGTGFGMGGFPSYNYMSVGYGWGNPGMGWGAPGMGWGAGFNNAWGSPFYDPFNPWGSPYWGWGGMHCPMYGPGFFRTMPVYVERTRYVTPRAAINRDGQRNPQSRSSVSSTGKRSASGTPSKPDFQRNTNYRSNRGTQSYYQNTRTASPQGNTRSTQPATARPAQSSQQQSTRYARPAQRQQNSYYSNPNGTNTRRSSSTAPARQYSTPQRTNTYSRPASRPSYPQRSSGGSSPRVSPRR